MNLQRKQPATVEAAFILIMAREQLSTRLTLFQELLKTSRNQSWMTDCLQRFNVGIMKVPSMQYYSAAHFRGLGEGSL